MFNSRLLAACCGFFLVGCLLSNAAEPTKSYREIKLPAPPKDATRLAKDFVKGKTSGESAAKALKSDITYMITLLTQKENAANYGRIRSQITSTYLRGTKSQAARNQLIANVSSVAGYIAERDEFSPAARLNCLTILAQLDASEERRDRPALPAPQVLPLLQKIIKDPKQPDYLKAIALYGLQRHVAVNWPLNRWQPADKSEMQKMLLAVLADEAKLPSELDSKTWLQRRTYDIFANIHSPAAADYALKDLGDPERVPALRLSALKYLSRVDNAALPEAKRKDYLIAASHFLRSQLIRWYELEDDKIKRKSQGTGGYGGMGGDGMGGLDDDGGMDDDEGGYGGGDLGGYGEGGGVGGDPKLIDTQDWDTRIARRVANEIAQAMHVALNDIPLVEERPITDAGTKPLLQASPELKSDIEELISLVEDFQAAVNDIAITDVTSLLQTTKTPIEEIMDFVKAMDGYSTKYPESVDEEEEVLKDADEEAPAQDPSGNSPDGQDPPGGAPADGPAGPEAPGGNAGPDIGGNAGADGADGTPAAPGAPGTSAGDTGS